VRATKPDIKWKLTAALQTGYSIYMRHTIIKRGPANKSALQQLYYNYMDGKDIVHNITAEATATKHIGQGKQEESLHTTTTHCGMGANSHARMAYRK
jgi:hypothetical protein